MSKEVSGLNRTRQNDGTTRKPKKSSDEEEENRRERTGVALR
jgi:hypothetical protein